LGLSGGMGKERGILCVLHHLQGPLWIIEDQDCICYLSHPICAILLCHLEQTSSPSIVRCLHQVQLDQGGRNTDWNED
jgi:hypothetical protein